MRAAASWGDVFVLCTCTSITGGLVVGAGCANPACTVIAPMTSATPPTNSRITPPISNARSDTTFRRYRYQHADGTHRTDRGRCQSDRLYAILTATPQFGYRVGGSQSATHRPRTNCTAPSGICGRSYSSGYLVEGRSLPFTNSRIITNAKCFRATIAAFAN
jgi:hypothetical protein